MGLFLPERPRESFHPTNGTGRTAASSSRARDLNFTTGASQALFNISVQDPERPVTALSDRRAGGKSTFLRTLNRMNDIIEGTRPHRRDHARRGQHLRTGDRRRRSASGSGWCSRSRRRSRSRSSTTSPTGRGSPARRTVGSWRRSSNRVSSGRALWDEVSSRLNLFRHGPLGGQQQRLCIARAGSP